MFKIQEKIIEYIERNTIRALMKGAKVGTGVIYSIKNGENKKTYSKKTLDNLYNFFSLDKDKFYKERIIKYRGNYSPMGIIFRKKREKLKLSIKDVAKSIKGTSRHIRRIESGAVNYDIDGFYLQKLLDLYDFPKKEKAIVYAYSISLYQVLELGKEYNK